MICYFDIQGLEGIGVIFHGKRVVFTGISVRTEPEEYRGHEALIPFSKEDFHFFFDNDVPDLNFYAVPALWIIGHDSAGGYFVTTETDFLFQENLPLFYVSAESQVYLIKGNSTQFLTGKYRWREDLEESDEIKIYSSRLMAEKDFDIHNADELNLTSLETSDGK